VRLKNDRVEFLKQSIIRYLPDVAVYLFGSRVDNNLKGGDIDILVLDDKVLTGQEKRNIKLAFYKEFGEQKIDIVSIKSDEPSYFKELALLEGVEL
jgi:predicted nucleotidyltransferase